MKSSLAELLKQIPGAPTQQWPAGERYVVAFSHGTMSVGFYAPTDPDPQQPHQRDELYIVHAGSGEFVVDGERRRCAAGDVLFVAAGVRHRFEHFTADFSTWVVFWGPPGGEGSD
jgi:mannose-6-phosphate isomerase-like protein (cupin superfamily)